MPCQKVFVGRSVAWLFNNLDRLSRMLSRVVVRGVVKGGCQGCCQVKEVVVKGVAKIS